ncbi:flavin reductase like domain-containing protein [Lactifluus volemus]|nr:flavin reductase like domain-containing protein [Lactifluus volemus]
MSVRSLFSFSIPARLFQVLGTVRLEKNNACASSRDGAARRCRDVFDAIPYIDLHNNDIPQLIHSDYSADFPRRNAILIHVISMAPHHLVAFSLRVPSRMATTLTDLSAKSANTRTTTPSPFSDEPGSAHMVINLLAAPQTHAATLFSRPDLYPRPFEDPSVQWSLSRDGFPMLHGCLGALSCRVVGAPWALNDLSTLGDKLTHKATNGKHDSANVGDVWSELFIAQVIRVEAVPRAEGAVDDNLRTLPLVYHRRGYTTTTDKLPLNQKTNS